MGSRGPSKYQWTEKELLFIEINFHCMTNRQLADSLQLTLTLVRTQCYKMGLKRMELEYWTAEQVRYLRRRFKTCGDLELAEIFQKKWPKKKGWTLKHIEKKRKYLFLKRTKKQLRKIKDKAIKKGVYLEGLKKTWLHRGVAREGEIRYWKKWKSNQKFPVIKTKDGWVHWGPFTWEKHYGPVPKDHNVVFRDGDNTNLVPENLELLSHAELAIKNVAKSSSGLSDNYVAGIMTTRRPKLRELIKKNPELIDLKRQQLILNRTINEKGTIDTGDKANA